MTYSSVENQVLCFLFFFDEADYSLYMQVAHSYFFRYSKMLNSIQKNISFRAEN